MKTVSNYTREPVLCQQVISFCPVDTAHYDDAAAEYLVSWSAGDRAHGGMSKLTNP